MTRPLAALLFLLLAGCTTLEVHYRPIKDPKQNPEKGTIQIRAIRGEDPQRLSNGYLFTIQNASIFSGAYESSSSAPTDTGDLEPGHYLVTVTGKHINPISVEMEVRAGHKTDLVLWVRNARRATTMEDAAEVTGKVVLYTVFCAVVATVFVVDAIVSSELSDDDDDNTCPRCGQTSCVCVPDKKKAPPPGPVSNYRNKK